MNDSYTLLYRPFRHDFKNKEKIEDELLAEFYSKISNLKVPAPPE
ncbi:hypothetical protein [Tenacibaculum sp. nBUS_03]